MGVDGAGWGFLVHTPEVPLDQLPVVHYCPMDSDPPSLSGKDVIQAIRTAMECSLESRSENPELFENDSAAWELMVNVARNSLGINAELPRAGDKEAGMARAFVPPGYRYLPSADWVGVCAPNDSIDASVILPQHCDGDTLHRLASPDRIRSLLGEGKPASALLLAREFVWHNCYVSPACDEYFQFMLRAHRDLGRPLHADNLAVQIRKP